MLRFMQLLLGEAAPLEAVGLEDLQRAGEQADLIGAAEPGNGGLEFLVGDLAHGMHDCRQGGEDAVAHSEPGDEADRGGEDRNHAAGDQEPGERGLRLLVDLHRMVARRAAQRGKLRRQAGDLVVEIEHRDEAGTTADAQQEQ